MGMVNKAVNYFGLFFGKEEEALQYLKENNTDYESDSLESNSLGLTCLNFFTGYGYALGYEMKLGETVDKYQEKWNVHFPNGSKKPEPITVVMSY